MDVGGQSSVKRDDSFDLSWPDVRLCGLRTRDCVDICRLWKDCFEPGLLPDWVLTSMVMPIMTKARDGGLRWLRLLPPSSRLA